MANPRLTPSNLIHRRTFQWALVLKIRTEATQPNATDSIQNAMNSSTDYLTTLVMSNLTITNIYSSNLDEKWKKSEKEKTKYLDMSCISVD